MGALAREVGRVWGWDLRPDVWSQGGLSWSIELEPGHSLEYPGHGLRAQEPFRSPSPCLQPRNSASFTLLQAEQKVAGLASVQKPFGVQVEGHGGPSRGRTPTVVSEGPIYL